ncbi:MAG: ABC transporter ATP-binding protein [Candidatus Hodarchaeales archaeon]|jgi:putative ABC transport system ATP-binding protein
MSLVNVENLHKTFKITRGDDIEVLKGISLQAGRGEFIAIMGPSGSGKSTLLNILASIEDYEAGKVVIDERNLNKVNAIDTRRYTTSMIFQDFNLLPYLTAVENVMFPMMISGEKEIIAKEKATKLLSKMELINRMNHIPDDLSGGEQQRVAIARALANGPKVLLADEPTGNLDSKTGDTIIDLFKDIIEEQKISIILVTHDFGIARKTDRILILREGTLHREEDVLEDL